MTASKANQLLGFLKQNFKDCSKQVKTTAYTTVVRLVLEYVSHVRDPHRKADIKVLEQVQRRGARYINNDCTTSTSVCVTDMIKGLGWESLEDRRYVTRLCLL